MTAPRTILAVCAPAGAAMRLAARLDRDRYRVWPTGRPTAAIQRVASLQPDAVLLDLSLPDCAGFELAGRLALDAPEVPVLFLSPPDGTSELARGLALSGGAALTLPASAETLDACLAGILIDRAAADDDRSAVASPAVENALDPLAAVAWREAASLSPGDAARAAIRTDCRRR